MATYRKTYSDGNTPSGKNTYCVEFTNNSRSKSEISPNIPDYSILNNVIISFQWRTDKSLTSGDLSVYVNKDADEWLSWDDGANQIGSTSQAKNSYVSVYLDKNSSIEDLSTRLPDFFNSGKKNVGEYSGSYSVCMWFSASITRNFYWKNMYMEFDYTPPTFTISAKSNGGGTVSGGGTFNVTVANQTKTITATPSTGYKFVKWVDSNGNTYSGENNKTLNVTISQNSISAFSTTVTYTAYFEKITYTATFKNYDGTVLQTVQVQHGSAPSYTGSTPTKPADTQYTYTFSGWSPSIGTITSDTTYTAQFTATKRNYTINWRNVDGSIVSTKTLNSGATLGTLPTISRSGYIFAGWIPCAPVKKIDNTILDSCYYDGAVAYPLLQSYKYTNNLSMHIEVYMADWMDIKNSTRQIMSCTESGGWGFGYQANSEVDGAEAHGFEVHTGSYTGYDLKFGTSGEYTNNNWYSFDITFSNGVIEIFVNGTSKGKRTASSSTIKYNSSNTIFVGGEAKGDTSSAQNYFKGYISNVFIANQGTKLQIATTSTVVNGNIDYYPIWRKNTTFTATFKNHDGTVLQTVSVEHGSTPKYTGSTPTKSSTAEYSYSFTGWSPSLGAINTDTTYTAQFSATKRKYTIDVSANNGTVSGGGTYEYGASITLTAISADGYKFEKWSDGNTQNPRVITVTGNATYEAQFRRLVLKFKSVKIYYPTGANVASPTNPLDAGETAQIVVKIAME